MGQFRNGDNPIPSQSQERNTEIILVQFNLRTVLKFE